MRRLTVVQVLPALQSGGVERSTIEIAAALVSAGHASHVISTGGRLVAALEAAGSVHHVLPIAKKSLTTLRSIGPLRALLRGLQPDVVHARSRLPAWLCLAALRGLEPRPAFVTTVHGLNSPGFYSGVMTRGDRVIAVSNSVAAHVQRHWPAADNRLLVIPRGIDPRSFPRRRGVDRRVRAELAIDHPLLATPLPLLLLPGRGTRLKGHATALTLLADLKRAGERALLWLLGAEEPDRDAYLEELRRLAADLGVADQVLITPPRSDIARVYAASDLVLQTSEKPEAFGRTVVEALAVGTPVVGWAHGGVGELLAELYPAGAVAFGDAEALRLTVRRVLDAPPPPPAVIPYTLAAMQTATLETYTRVAR